jgi:2-polyprenyl-3-methyl-5-hydroxy-6-metoxy-1,4-benzoquinol methylase/predicted  nucleic acid-binding Zn-ribbon protein
VSSQSTQAKVVRLVGQGKRVLEIGCATGYMSRALRDQGCSVVAVEIDKTAAGRASAFCERVIVGDIERIDLRRELGSQRFDVIVVADVLEHLKDPLLALWRVRSYLNPTGCVVGSIPNVAHGSVRLALLTGSFPYSEVGLLDRTHLRFFTCDSLDQLIREAGFSLTHLERQQADINESEVPFAEDAVPVALLRSLRRDPEALTYQYIFVATPTSRAGSRPKAAELPNEVADPEVAQLRETIDQLGSDKVSAERDLRRLGRRLELLKAQRRRENLQWADLKDRLEAEQSQMRERAADLVADKETMAQEILELRSGLADRESQLKRRLEALWSLREELEKFETRIAELVEERRAAKREQKRMGRCLTALEQRRQAAESAVGQLEGQRVFVAEQGEEILRLRAEREVLATREATLREMLVVTHRQMINRDEEFQMILTEVLQGRGSDRPTQRDGYGDKRSVPSQRLRYQQMIAHIQDAIESCTPPDATVIVISKGDPELLKLGSRKAWHFPQTADGVYAGFHPATSEEAISHLEDLRERGGEFLLFPATSLWWLGHYVDFRDYLESRYRMAATVDDVCMIVDVRTRHAPSVPGSGAAPAATNGHSGRGRKIGELVHPLRALRRSRLRR